MAIGAGSEDFYALLVNRARSFIYSTAPPAAQAVAAKKALAVIASQRGTVLREQLWVNIRQLGQPQSERRLEPTVRRNHQAEGRPRIELCRSPRAQFLAGSCQPDTPSERRIPSRAYSFAGTANWHKT